MIHGESDRVHKKRTRGPGPVEPKCLVPFWSPYPQSVGATWPSRPQPNALRHTGGTGGGPPKTPSGMIKPRRETYSHLGFYVGLLRNYCQQARKTAELAELLATARDSTRAPDDRPLPQQNALHRSVVKLLIEDYEAGASTYELAERYNVRRNTVRDTLRRAGFDLTIKAKRAALSEEQKAEARRLFEDGSTRRELMELYGVSESTIRRALRTP